MADKVYVGTVGMPIRLVLLDNGEVHDPTGATVTRIVVARPDATQLVKEAPDVLISTTSTADGSRTCLEYKTVDGDLNGDGTYAVQGYVEDAAGKWYSERVTFRVYPRLQSA